MKAITVRQPWAWAIMHGGKDIENRSRNIAGKYRGPVVIHAGKAIIDEQLPRTVAASVGFLSRKLGRLIPDVPQFAGGSDDPWNVVAPWYGSRGGALGTVDLIDVHDERGCPGLSCSPWAFDDGSVHLLLANPRPFPEPIPYKGALGLWNFPDELLPEDFR